MKYAIRRNSAAKHGYEFVIKHDDGHEEIKAITAKTSDGYLKLPENPMWKMARISLLEQTQGDLELTEKRPIKQVAADGKPKTSGKWLEYVTKEDLKMLEEIKARAVKRMQVEIAKEAVKKAEEYLKQLMKGAE
jgi:hypothetical protein